MTLQECYAALGGDYADVTARLRSENLVRKFARKFLQDTSYELLCSSMQEENYSEAFRAAHTIKGVCQNLSFNKLLESSSQLTEALRAGEKPTDASLVEQVAKDYQQTIAAIQALDE